MKKNCEIIGACPEKCMNIVLLCSIGFAKICTIINAKWRLWTDPTSLFLLYNPSGFSITFYIKFAN